MFSFRTWNFRLFQISSCRFLGEFLVIRPGERQLCPETTINAAEVFRFTPCHTKIRIDNNNVFFWGGFVPLKVTKCREKNNNIHKRDTEPKFITNLLGNFILNCSVEKNKKIDCLKR